MGEGLIPSPGKPVTYSEIFDAQFPHYLALGMSAQEYWYGDPELVRAYRKAKEIKDRERNDFCWLQGRYIYDAICKASPLYNAWKPSEPIPYNDEPYPMSSREAEDKEAKLAKEKMEKQREKLIKLMNKEREGADHG